MKICPMCSMIQFDFVEKKNPNVCMVPMCGFEDKPVDQLTGKEINNLLGAYEYEKLEDGTYRIVGVENLRDIGLRGPVALSQIVSEIDEDAMSHLKFMTIIELPRGLRSIGNEAFASCRDLFKVFIPKTVTSMGKGVFKNCYDLKRIECEAEAMPEGWDPEWLEGCDAEPVWGVPEIDV